MKIIDYEASLEKKLSIEDFSLKRSPKNLLCWSLNQFEKIKTKSEKDYFLKRKGLTKVLIEEIYPLALFCSSYYQENEVLIKPNIGNENFDAIVFKNTLKEKILEKIEITQAIDGYEDSLKRELLLMGKPAPFSGIFEVKRMGNNRVIEATLGGGSIYPLISKICSLSSNAIKRKMKKDYDKGTILLVVVNSLPVIPITFIGDIVKNEFERLDFKEKCTFSKVFLINSSEEKEQKHFCVIG